MIVCANCSAWLGLRLVSSVCLVTGSMTVGTVCWVKSGQRGVGTGLRLKRLEVPQWPHERP